MAIENGDISGVYYGQTSAEALYKGDILIWKAGKNYIQFNDPAFESACAQLYGDGIGMTMEDFQAVTDNSPMYAFNGNSQITDMTELQYFTNIPGWNKASDMATETTYWIFDMQNLTTIHLPDQIQYIGRARQQNPYTSSYQYKGIFYKCPSLQNVHLPNSLLWMYPDDSSVWPIGDLRNTSLYTVDLGVVSGSFVEIYFPPVQYLQCRCFFNMTLLKKVVIEEGTTPFQVRDSSGYDAMFYNCQGVTIDFPSNTTQLHVSMFQSIKNSADNMFILRAVNPPTEIDTSGNATTNPMVYSSYVDLYVPDESVSLYQQNSIYANFKSIKGISQLPSDYSPIPN